MRIEIWDFKGDRGEQIRSLAPRSAKFETRGEAEGVGDLRFEISKGPDRTILVQWMRLKM